MMKLLDQIINNIGFGAEDPVHDMKTVEGLQRYINTPTNQEKRAAFFGMLSGLGDNNDFGAAANRVSEMRQNQRNTRLGTIQENAALKALLAGARPKRRESWGRDAQGNPVKFYENEFDDGRVEKIEGTDVPLYKPTDPAIDLLNQQLKLAMLNSRLNPKPKPPTGYMIDPNNPNRVVRMDGVPTQRSERTPSEAANFEFQKQLAIKQADDAAAAPAFRSLLDQAEKDVAQYLPTINGVPNPNQNKEAIEEITSAGGSGQLLPDFLRYGDYAAGDARMKQLEAFGKTLSGADFASMFKPMSNADVQMMADLGSIMANPKISDESRRAAMEKFVTELIPKMRGVLDKKQYQNLSPNQANAPFSNSAAPEGVSPEVWAEMNETERAAWQ